MIRLNDSPQWFGHVSLVPEPNDYFGLTHKLQYFGQDSIELPIGWKEYVETFLDNYHLRAYQPGLTGLVEKQMDSLRATAHTRPFSDTNGPALRPSMRGCLRADAVAKARAERSQLYGQTARKI